MAAVLSFFIPGLGQLVQGRVIAAVIFFVLTVGGYICFLLPGLLFHLVTILDAAWYAQHRFEKTIARALERNNAGRGR